MPRVLTASDLSEFRNRVRAAATRLFAEVGYDGFNMRELASRLGVSAMTAYRYFEDKNEILSAMRACEFERLAERLELAGESSGTPRERFTRVCQAYVSFAREEGVHYRLMFDLSQPRAASVPELRQAEQRAYEAFSASARLVVRADSADTDPERLSRLAWACLHGMMTLTLMDVIPESELDGLVGEAVRRLTGPGTLLGDQSPMRCGHGDERAPLATSRLAGAVHEVALTAAE